MKKYCRLEIRDEKGQQCYVWQIDAPYSIETIERFAANLIEFTLRNDDMREIKSNGAERMGKPRSTE